MSVAMVQVYVLDVNILSKQLIWETFQKAIFDKRSKFLLCA